MTTIIPPSGPRGPRPVARCFTDSPESTPDRAPLSGLARPSGSPRRHILGKFLVVPKDQGSPWFGSGILGLFGPASLGRVLGVEPGLGPFEPLVEKRLDGI